MKKVNGLILTGGKSSRLGYRKERIRWHGVPQWEYLYHKLEPLLNEVFLSDNSTWQSKIPTIIDKEPNKGPIGGIVSAMKTDSDASWFVIACDLPLISDKSISDLLEVFRNDAKLTCFFNTNQNRPEPLVSIWPPDLATSLNNSILQGNHSLQPHLSSAKHIPISSEEVKNVNTILDYFSVKSRLPYVPIDCNYYDHIEASALQSSVLIEYFDGKNLITTDEKIVTTEIRDHIETLITTSRKIRLDMIYQINGIPNPIH